MEFHAGGKHYKLQDNTDFEELVCFVWYNLRSAALEMVRTAMYTPLLLIVVCRSCVISKLRIHATLKLASASHTNNLFGVK